MIILKGDEVHGFVIFEESVFRMTTVPLPPVAQRLDAEHAVLPGKSVTIIGCGSLGSKVATMLARAGVGDFFLLDDDLLLPDNLVRHDLDWRDVGTHKVDALAQRIRNVNPAAKVFVQQQKIGGQEASGSADAALASLARRDLVVDATANDAVLNLVSGVAHSSQKPIVWAKIYGGGFGGLLARSRPLIDPSPLAIRRATENWFFERGYTPRPAARNYATNGDGPPLIADDADVTSVAAATARMVIDTLLERSPSFFPFSAYVFGLAPEPGLFTQAFETFPIDMTGTPATEPQPELSPEETSAELQEIVKIMQA